MLQETPLIATIVAALVLAFVFAAIANRVRVPPIVGYLVAGIVLGPFTPGFAADLELASQLAEIGVILLMFGAGLHVSLRDLWSVRSIAVPGVLLQVVVATAFGWGLARLIGWSDVAGVFFGLSLSVASTVVTLRAMQERHVLETERGRIGIGWLIVEDLAMVLALVLLPVVVHGSEAVAAGANGTGGAFSGAPAAIALTLAKIAGFFAAMLIVGQRLIPLLLHYVAYTGSRELFRLAVLAIALGVAYGAAVLFDVSFALGAFFAGMILAESQLSQQAAQESLPLRDAFAVLFFVSVGMLFDPTVVLRETGWVAATLVVIMVPKSVVAYAVVRAFGYPAPTALMIAASRAQIGEFAFILSALGTQLGVLPDEGRDLILAGALLSITLNPLVFAVIDRWQPRRGDAVPLPSAPSPPPRRAAPTVPGHAVVVGFGRVGALVAEGLYRRGLPFMVMESGDALADDARRRGFALVVGNAAQPGVLAAANLSAARWLLVAIPNAFEAGQVVTQARAINPNLKIIARAHSDAEVEHLRSLGANRIIMGEREIAAGMLDDVLAGPATR